MKFGRMSGRGRETNAFSAVKEDAGDDAFRRGGYQAAIDAYSDAFDHLIKSLRKNITCEDATPLLEAAGNLLYKSAEAHLKLGHFDDALETVQYSLHYSHRNARAWHCKARCLEGMQQYAAAIAACERMLMIMGNPPGGQAYLDRLKALAVTQPQPPPIIALCASHILSPACYERLQQMVLSWYLQEHALPLIISLSYDPVAFTQQVMEAQVKQLQHNHPGLTILLWEEPLLHEGMHYSRLMVGDDSILAQIDSEETWVIFTNDDAIWHPKRSSCYFQTLTNTQQPLLQQVLSMCSPMYLPASPSDVVKGPFCVSSLVTSGQALVLPEIGGGYQQLQLRQEGQEGLEGGVLPDSPLRVADAGDYWCDYWCYGLRLGALQQFFSSCSEEVITHRFWDSCLVKFIRSCDGGQTLLVDSSNTPGMWMYYYRPGDEDPGTMRVTTTQRLTHYPWDDDDADNKEAAFREQVAYCAENDLALLCARCYEFDEEVFNEFVKLANKDLDLEPWQIQTWLAASLALARQLLKEPLSIYHKLLGSPRCAFDTSGLGL